MKKYITILKIVLIVSLVFTVVILSINNSKLKESVNVYDNNFKALNLERDSLNKTTIAYKFNIEQLEYINDSILNDLNNTRKQLKIKDKEILQMQSIKTEISTKDSIFIKDTIFRDNFVKIDTIIGDNWHTLAVNLNKDKLAIKATYTSDLKVFAKSTKEIIGTPKKCWLGRVFQKKYKAIRVVVKDENPYSVIKEKKFIIIE